MPAPLAVEIIGLGKRYGDFVAVADLDLAIPRGEIFALLGPNGAGKTTTILMLMGILQPTSGQARIDGLDCFADRVEVKRRLGYVPDEPVFYDYLQGLEVLRFVGDMHGLDRAEVARRSDELLARLALGDAAGEYAMNYSKGMKKKLALACALLHRPDILILDEPTSGLDPAATRTLHALMREQAEGGRTILFSTHLLEQAEKLSHRVGIIHRGRMAAVGSLDALRSSLAPGGSLEEIFFAVTRDEDAAPPLPDGTSRTPA
jgi:ABC-2 type transport system ATP-binding protein